MGRDSVVNLLVFLFNRLWSRRLGRGSIYYDHCYLFHSLSLPIMPVWKRGKFNGRYIGKGRSESEERNSPGLVVFGGIRCEVIVSVPLEYSGGLETITLIKDPDFTLSK